MSLSDKSNLAGSYVTTIRSDGTQGSCIITKSYVVALPVEQMAPLTQAFNSDVHALRDGESKPDCYIDIYKLNDMEDETHEGTGEIEPIALAQLIMESPPLTKFRDLANVEITNTEPDKTKGKGGVDFEVSIQKDDGEKKEATPRQSKELTPPRPAGQPIPVNKQNRGDIRERAERLMSISGRNQPGVSFINDVSLGNIIDLYDSVERKKALGGRAAMENVDPVCDPGHKDTDYKGKSTRHFSISGRRQPGYAEPGDEPKTSDEELMELTQKKKEMSGRSLFVTVAVDSRKKLVDIIPKVSELQTPIGKLSAIRSGRASDRQTSSMWQDTNGRLTSAREQFPGETTRYTEASAARMPAYFAFGAPIAGQQPMVLPTSDASGIKSKPQVYIGPPPPINQQWASHISRAYDDTLNWGAYPVPASEQFQRNVPNMGDYHTYIENQQRQQQITHTIQPTTDFPQVVRPSPQDYWSGASAMVPLPGYLSPNSRLKTQTRIASIDHPPTEFQGVLRKMPTTTAGITAREPEKDRRRPVPDASIVQNSPLIQDRWKMFQRQERASPKQQIEALTVKHSPALNNNRFAIFDGSKSAKQEPKPALKAIGTLKPIRQVEKRFAGTVNDASDTRPHTAIGIRTADLSKVPSRKIYNGNDSVGRNEQPPNPWFISAERKLPSPMVMPEYYGDPSSIKPATELPQSFIVKPFSGSDPKKDILGRAQTKFTGQQGELNRKAQLSKIAELESKQILESPTKQRLMSICARSRPGLAAIMDGTYAATSESEQIEKKKFLVGRALMLEEKVPGEPAYYPGDYHVNSGRLLSIGGRHNPGYAIPRDLSKSNEGVPFDADTKRKILGGRAFLRTEVVDALETSQKKQLSELISKAPIVQPTSEPIKAGSGHFDQAFKKFDDDAATVAEEAQNTTLFTGSDNGRRYMEVQKTNMLNKQDEKGPDTHADRAEPAKRLQTNSFAIFKQDVTDDYLPKLRKKAEKTIDKTIKRFSLSSPNEFKEVQLNRMQQQHMQADIMAPQVTGGKAFAADHQTANATSALTSDDTKGHQILRTLYQQHDSEFLRNEQQGHQQSAALIPEVGGHSMIRRTHQEVGIMRPTILQDSIRAPAAAINAQPSSSPGKRFENSAARIFKGEDRSTTGEEFLQQRRAQKITFQQQQTKLTSADAEYRQAPARKRLGAGVFSMFQTDQVRSNAQLPTSHVQNSAPGTSGGAAYKYATSPQLVTPDNAGEINGSQSIPQQRLGKLISQVSTIVSESKSRYVLPNQSVPGVSSRLLSISGRTHPGYFPPGVSPSPEASRIGVGVSGISQTGRREVTGMLGQSVTREKTLTASTSQSVRKMSNSSQGGTAVKNKSDRDLGEMSGKSSQPEKVVEKANAPSAGKSPAKKNSPTERKAESGKASPVNKKSSPGGRKSPPGGKKSPPGGKKSPSPSAKKSPASAKGGGKGGAAGKGRGAGRGRSKNQSARDSALEVYEPFSIDNFSTNASNMASQSSSLEKDSSVAVTVRIFRHMHKTSGIPQSRNQNAATGYDSETDDIGVDTSSILPHFTNYNADQSNRLLSTRDKFSQKTFQTKESCQQTPSWDHVQNHRNCTQTSDNDARKSTEFFGIWNRMSKNDCKNIDPAPGGKARSVPMLRLPEPMYATKFGNNWSVRSPTPQYHECTLRSTQAEGAQLHQRDASHEESPRTARIHSACDVFRRSLWKRAFFSQFNTRKTQRNGPGNSTLKKTGASLVSEGPIKSKEKCARTLAASRIQLLSTDNYHKTRDIHMHTLFGKNDTAVCKHQRKTEEPVLKGTLGVGKEALHCSDTENSGVGKYCETPTALTRDNSAKIMQQGCLVVRVHKTPKDSQYHVKKSARNTDSRDPMPNEDTKVEHKRAVPLKSPLNREPKFVVPSVKTFANGPDIKNKHTDYVVPEPQKLNQVQRVLKRMQNQNFGQREPLYEMFDRLEMTNVATGVDEPMTTTEENQTKKVPVVYDCVDKRPQSLASKAFFSARTSAEETSSKPLYDKNDKTSFSTVQPNGNVKQLQAHQQSEEIITSAISGKFNESNFGDEACSRNDMQDHLNQLQTDLTRTPPSVLDALEKLLLDVKTTKRQGNDRYACSNNNTLSSMSSPFKFSDLDLPGHRSNQLLGTEAANSRFSHFNSQSLQTVTGQPLGLPLQRYPGKLEEKNSSTLLRTTRSSVHCLVQDIVDNARLIQDMVDKGSCTNEFDKEGIRFISDTVKRLHNNAKTLQRLPLPDLGDAVTSDRPPKNRMIDTEGVFSSISAGTHLPDKNLDVVRSQLHNCNIYTQNSAKRIPVTSNSTYPVLSNDKSERSILSTRCFTPRVRPVIAKQDSRGTINIKKPIDDVLQGYTCQPDTTKIPMPNYLTNSPGHSRISPNGQWLDNCYGDQLLASTRHTTGKAALPAPGDRQGKSMITSMCDYWTQFMAKRQAQAAQSTPRRKKPMFTFPSGNTTDNATKTIVCPSKKKRVEYWEKQYSTPVPSHVHSSARFSDTSLLNHLRRNSSPTRTSDTPRPFTIRAALHFGDKYEASTGVVRRSNSTGSITSRNSCVTNGIKSKGQNRYENGDLSLKNAVGHFDLKGVHDYKNCCKFQDDGSTVDNLSGTQVVNKTHGTHKRRNFLGMNISRFHSDELSHKPVDQSISRTAKSVADPTDNRRVILKGRESGSNAFGRVMAHQPILHSDVSLRFTSKEQPRVQGKQQTESNLHNTVNGRQNSALDYTFGQNDLRRRENWSSYFIPQKQAEHLISYAYEHATLLCKMLTEEMMAHFLPDIPVCNQCGKTRESIIRDTVSPCEHLFPDVGQVYYEVHSLVEEVANRTMGTISLDQLQRMACIGQDMSDSVMMVEGAVAKIVEAELLEAAEQSGTRVGRMIIDQACSRGRLMVSKALQAVARTKTSRTQNTRPSEVGQRITKKQSYVINLNNNSRSGNNNVPTAESESIDGKTTNTNNNSNGTNESLQLKRGTLQSNFLFRLERIAGGKLEHRFWINVVAKLFCVCVVVSCFVCSIVTCLTRGSTFGKNETKNWITLVFGFLLAHALLLEPLKVVLLATFAGVKGRYFD